MKLDLITRAELAKELKICTATLDLWRKEYLEATGCKFPGEVYFGDKRRTIRFKRTEVMEFLLETFQ
jgi:hypothetical protein